MSETPVWTDERLKLKDLWNKGLSISQIGEELDVSQCHCRQGLPAWPAETAITDLNQIGTEEPHLW